MNDDENLPIKISIKIDSKDAASVINKLISTIKAPFDRWLKSTEEITAAKADTKALLIRAKAAKPLSLALGISEDEAITLLLRTEHREIIERLRQQKNIEAIVSGSVQYLPQELTETSVDEDWTLDFIEQSKNTSNEYLQQLWSRILAGQIVQPGKHPKRLLSLVRSLSQKDAELFNKFCSLIWKNKELGCFSINLSKSKGLDDFGVTYVDLIELDSMGLIRLDDITGFSLGNNEYLALDYFDNTTLFAVNKNNENIRLPIILLTKLGEALSEIVSATENTVYKEMVFAKLVEQGLSIIENDEDQYDIPTFLRKSVD